jgi:CIC family chloride channel protein
MQLALEAAAIGAVSGLSVAGVRLFFRLLQWCVTGHAGLLSTAAEALPLWRRALTPALGGLAAIVVLSIARRVMAGLRTVEYVEAVRFDEGRIPMTSTLWRTLSSACSVATGAAIGREGSMIQFAAATVSWLGQRLSWIRLPLAQQVACGVAAAVAAAYQAPLAGVFFALEIVMAAPAWNVIPVLLISAFAGAAASRSVLPGGPLFAPHGPMGITPFGVCFALLLAVFLGVLGPLYLWAVRSLRFARKWPLSLFWSGAVVGILSLLTPLVWGNGDAALLGDLQSSATVHALLLVLLVRLGATALCVGTGTVGGVFTPTLFVGSALGLLIGHLAPGGNGLVFAVIGMGCLLAAATHAPLMASLMIAELTGQWMLFPLLLICNLVAWQVATRISAHSLYAIASDLPAALPRPDLVSPAAANLPDSGSSQFEAAD